MHLTLRTIRESKGYTLNEAASHCGISESKMEEAENKPGDIPASIAIKLRNLYGIPIDYIDLMT